MAGEGAPLREITLEEPAFERIGYFNCRLVDQHPFHVVVDDVNVFGLIDGVEPQRTSAEVEKHDVSQRARSEASGNSEMQAAPDAALLPLALKFVKSQRGKTFFCMPAAASIANE